MDSHGFKGRVWDGTQVMLRLDPWKATGFYAFCHNGGLGDWCWEGWTQVGMISDKLQKSGSASPYLDHPVRVVNGDPYVVQGSPIFP